MKANSSCLMNVNINKSDRSKIALIINVKIQKKCLHSVFVFILLMTLYPSYEITSSFSSLVCFEKPKS